MATVTSNISPGTAPDADDFARAKEQGVSRVALLLPLSKVTVDIEELTP